MSTKHKINTYISTLLENFVNKKPSNFLINKGKFPIRNDIYSDMSHVTFRLYRIDKIKPYNNTITTYYYKNNYREDILSGITLSFSKELPFKVRPRYKTLCNLVLNNDKRLYISPLQFNVFKL